MEKLKIPYSLLDLEDKDRDEIVAVLLQASTLPKTQELPSRTGNDEHNMWERNVDPLMAEAEDELYRSVAEPAFMNLMDLVNMMGLPVEGIEKSFEAEFDAWEDELIKAKGSGRSKMSDFIKNMAKVTTQKKEQFMEWIDDGKAFTKAQLKQIDKVLSKRLPNYSNYAEAYMTRAGFIGKIRGEQEKQGFEVMGAYIDRFPNTIRQAEKQNIVLTQRQKNKAEKEGRKVTILPLTPMEAESVKHAVHHAGDKLTEVSDRHKAGIRQLVIQAKRERWSAQELASKLFDTFGDHNRDWRRVAITELAFATNDAYLAGCDEGDRLLGMGAVNACKHCQLYVIGKEFTVTHNPPSRDTYNADMKQVWVGKSNYGRRVAEYRPAIPMHPNCRCRWHKISRFYKLGKDGKLELKTTAELINEERKARGLEPDEALTKLDNMSQEDRLRKLTEDFLANQ